MKSTLFWGEQTVKNWGTSERCSGGRESIGKNSFGVNWREIVKQSI